MTYINFHYTEHAKRCVAMVHSSHVGFTSLIPVIFKSFLHRYRFELVFLGKPSYTDMPLDYINQCGITE